MTETDWDHFAELFVALCRSFHKAVTATTPQQARDYFDHLQDYPVRVIESAKADIIRGAKFFPKVVDWRRACDSIQSSRPTPRVPLTQQLEDGTTAPVYCCANCQDSGWRPACGCRYGDMDAHGMCAQHPRVDNGGVEYRQAMMACACRESNPAYQANRSRVSGAAREAGRDAA